MPTPHHIDHLANRSEIRRVDKFRRIALACAMVPMTVGPIVVFLYWIFDWGWLVIAGMGMLGLGALSVVAGLVFTVFWARERRVVGAKTATTLPRSRPILMVLLLLTNVPVAFLCLWFGVSLAFQWGFQITIYNDTGLPLERCMVRSDSSPRTPRMVAPGAYMSEVFKLNRIVGLHLYVEQAGKSKDVPIPPPPIGTFFGAPENIDIHVRPNLDTEIRILSHD